MSVKNSVGQFLHALYDTDHDMTERTYTEIKKNSLPETTIQYHYLSIALLADTVYLSPY